MLQEMPQSWPLFAGAEPGKLQDDCMHGQLFVFNLFCGTGLVMCQKPSCKPKMPSGPLTNQGLLAEACTILLLLQVQHRAEQQRQVHLQSLLNSQGLNLSLQRFYTVNEPAVLGEQLALSSQQQGMLLLCC